MRDRLFQVSRLYIMLLFNKIASVCLVVMFLSSTCSVLAAGMQPETSVVIVEEAEGEGTINVKNTDAEPVLLYSVIEDVEGDEEPLLILTPPVTRVEPGESQRVRFILTNRIPLKEQRLRRVTFEGIAPKDEAAKNKVGISVRRNLPVIINPKGLKKESAPWMLLKWSLKDGRLQMENPSAYVVRMGQTVTLIPSNASVQLPHTFILPGHKISLDLPADAAASTAVRLYPATVYGYTIEYYDALLSAP